jgi:hypothetical protein
MVKGYLKIGGHWKPPNEHNTSQTCVYCFEKLCHPITVINGKVKSIGCAFLRQNPKCPSTLSRLVIVSRDNVSSLAIGLSDVVFPPLYRI